MLLLPRKMLDSFNIGIPSRRKMQSMETGFSDFKETKDAELFLGADMKPYRGSFDAVYTGTYLRLSLTGKATNPPLSQTASN